VIVTGAARGLGKAIAQACAAEGAALVLVDIAAAVSDVAAGPRTLAVVGDVRDEACAQRTVAAAVDRFGRLDGLVNNAGVLAEADILETDAAIWEAAVGVNIEAPFRWTAAAIPAMLATGGGSVVNIASTEALLARPRHFAYVTSKSALLGMTRSVAIDFGRRGIRCNAVSPGSIDSEMFREYVRGDPTFEAELIGYNYAGRLGRPEEVAASCVHLLSDDAGFVNGANHVIDGGRTAGS